MAVSFLCTPFLCHCACARMCLFFAVSLLLCVFAVYVLFDTAGVESHQYRRCFIHALFTAAASAPSGMGEGEFAGGGEFCKGRLVHAGVQTSVAKLQILQALDR